jgi:hypothetical protein
MLSWETCLKGANQGLSYRSGLEPLLSVIRFCSARINVASASKGTGSTQPLIRITGYR